MHRAAAEEDCSQSLELEEKSVKVLYRRSPLASSHVIPLCSHLVLVSLLLFPSSYLHFHPSRHLFLLLLPRVFMCRAVARQKLLKFKVLLGCICILSAILLWSEPYNVQSKTMRSKLSWISEPCIWHNIKNMRRPSSILFLIISLFSFGLATQLTHHSHISTCA